MACSAQWPRADTGGAAESRTAADSARMDVFIHIQQKYLQK